MPSPVFRSSRNPNVAAITGNSWVSKKRCTCLQTEDKHYQSPQRNQKGPCWQDGKTPADCPKITCHPNGTDHQATVAIPSLLLVGFACRTSLFRAAASATGCFGRNRSMKPVGFLHILLGGISSRLLSRRWDNVGKTRINNPPNHHVCRWYELFPNGWFMIVLPTPHTYLRVKVMRVNRLSSIISGFFPPFEPC